MVRVGNTDHCTKSLAMAIQGCCYLVAGSDHPKVTGHVVPAGEFYIKIKIPPRSKLQLEVNSSACRWTAWNQDTWVSQLCCARGLQLTFCTNCLFLFGMAPPQVIVPLFLSGHHFLVFHNQRRQGNIHSFVKRPWVCRAHAAVGMCSSSAWLLQQSGPGKEENLQRSRDML